MSDAWIPVVYALIIAISAGFTSWLGARYGNKDTKNKLISMDANISRGMAHHDNLDETLKREVAVINHQNTVQTQKLDVVHDSINGRLAQERADMRELIRIEVAAALLEGKAAGVEQERQRTEEKK